MPELRRMDVREDLHEGKDPFGRIMAFVAQLDAHERWELLATFRPDPLIAVMVARGYEAASEEWDDGSWSIAFTPRAK